MLGNFTFHNPTKLHFGEDALNKLSEELKNYGKKVMLCYGGWHLRHHESYLGAVSLGHGRQHQRLYR